MPGKLFVPAQDGTITQVNNSVNAPAYGPALDTSVAALHTSGKTIAQETQNVGVPPFSPGIVGGEQILQTPAGSPYTIYTFPNAGKIWAASVSLSAGLSAGAGGVVPTYARVYIVGGRTLAYCEVGLSGTVAYGSNGDANTFPGFAVAAGTAIALDVNNANTLVGTGAIRAGGIIVGSIP